MIFSLFANSRARSNGILLWINNVQSTVVVHLPNALQVHGSDLNDVPGFFALENTIATPASHPCDVQ